MLLERVHYEKLSESRFFPLFLGVGSFVLMVTGFVPFEVVLIPSVTVDPSRWRRTVLWSVLGSSIGAACLAMIVRFWGWPIIEQLFPNMGTTASWARAQDWISHYGGFALILVAALPISQAPALILSGLLQIGFTHVLGAFLVGKTVKYALIARGVMKIEDKVRAKRHLHD